MMRIAVQFLTGLLGVIGIITGSVWFFTGLGTIEIPFGYSIPSAETEGVLRLLDNALRFFGGVWLTIGLSLLIAARDPYRYADLFRVAMVAVFVGRIGRTMSAYSVGVSPGMVIPTILELVLVPIVVLLFRRTQMTLQAK